MACSNDSGSRQADKWEELCRVLKTEEISLHAMAEAHLTDMEEPAIHN